jgi:hypothetical protein
MDGRQESAGYVQAGDVSTVARLLPWEIPSLASALNQAAAKIQALRRRR